MSRDRLDFLGALAWHIVRVVAVVFVAIRLITYIDGVERRGQTQHENLMREHEKMMRDHDASTREHRAILQRLAR